MRWRQVVLVVVVAVLAAAGGAAGAVLFTDSAPGRSRPSQDIDPPAAQEWEQARALWQARGPRDYRYIWTNTAIAAV